jgi:hypothetical protein
MIMHNTFELKDNPAETVLNSYVIRGVVKGRLVKTIMVTFLCPDGSTGSMDNDTFRQFYRSSKG